MILVHRSPSTLESFRADNLGVLSSPRRFYLDVKGWPWAADNDAFSQWDPERYTIMLGKITGLPGCLFVTSPDVVGDSVKTADLLSEWYPQMRATGHPIALVAQDGLVVDDVPWAEIQAVFVGGTNAFKLGLDAHRIVQEAKSRGLWVHMGRVNGLDRLGYAKSIGCDSVDGSSFSRFANTWLPSMLHFAS